MFKIFDLHNDFYLKMYSDKKRDKYLSKSKTYAENIISAIWTSEMNEKESFSAIERARDYISQKQNTFLAVEDLHFLSKETLEKFIAFKPLYAGLTWNRTNALAGGASESGRITEFGKKTIQEFEKNNIVIDTAHLNEDSFSDVLKYSSRPVICSHTAFYGLNQNARNLKDYQIKMIIESGGIIGITLVSEFLNGTQKSDVNDVVSHIDYFACKFGIDKLAIGTDFYGTKHLPSGIKSYGQLIKNVSNKLQKLGYTEKSIDKIFFSNASVFFGI